MESLCIFTINLVKATELHVGTQQVHIDDKAERVTKARSCTSHEEVSLQTSLQIKQ